MIKRNDLTEASNIILRAIDGLLLTSNDQKGRSGSDLRRACGDMKANVKNYIVDNIIGPKLSECFRLARESGATFNEFNLIRETIVAIPEGAEPWANSATYEYGMLATDEDSDRIYRCMLWHTSAEIGSFSEDRAANPNNWGDPLSLLAVLMKQACVAFSLEHMALCIRFTAFTSREDVKAIMAVTNDAFKEAEEVAADEMAQMTYRALVDLHAAVIMYLYDTARPLPRMIRYEFAAPKPTLVLSYRLYDTAARADELRKENKIVHPAFAPRTGVGLSA